MTIFAARASIVISSCYDGNTYTNNEFTLKEFSTRTYEKGPAPFAADRHTDCLSIEERDLCSMGREPVGERVLGERPLGPKKTWLNEDGSDKDIEGYCEYYKH